MKTVVAFRCPFERAKNLNFLELNVSGSTLFLIFILFEYVEGHMTLDDFSWTDPLRALDLFLPI